MKNLIIIVVVAAILVSCGGANNQKAELEKLKVQRDELNSKIEKLEAIVNPDGADSAAAVASVHILNLEQSVFNHFVEVQGVVDADQNITVSPQMAGIVTSVSVKEGSVVKKGSVMAQLDSKVLMQSIEEVKTQLDLANIIFEKQKTLWDKNIGSEVQFLQAKSSKESLERRIKTLEEQVALSRVVSPINGTVEDVQLKVGQMASPGLPTSTIRVINMATAKIKANVSENFAMRIKSNNQTFINFPDLGKEIETKLHFTSKFIDPTNRSFSVESVISANDIELRANMIAYMKIKDYTNEKALCLPVNLIQSNQNGKFVFTAKQSNGKWIATKTYIKPGIDYNGSAEILEGLIVGDKVISSGFQSLKEGETVVF